MKKSRLLGAVCTCLVLASYVTTISAAPIVYDLVAYAPPGLKDYSIVSGTVTTDGTLGAGLDPLAIITDYTVTLSNGAITTSLDFTDGVSGFGATITATSAELTLDAGSDSFWCFGPCGLPNSVIYEDFLIAPLEMNVLLYINNELGEDQGLVGSRVIANAAPITPAIDIEKQTNGNQADGANHSDVPRIAQGDTITWTYEVTNTGGVDFSEAEITVTDSQPGVVPVLDTPSAGMPSNAVLDFTGIFEAETSPGIFLPVAISSLNGIVLGSTQPATGSHPGAPDGSENPDIDYPWEFFTDTGMHLTTAPVTILSDDGAGNVLLDFSGWGVTWNANPVVPLDTGAWGGNPEGVAVVTCAVDCSVGDTYSLNYTATVPPGDPSGFGGIPYRLNLAGTVVAGDDLILSPGETWIYTASTTALDLEAPPSGVTVVPGCNNGRNTYENIGRVDIIGAGVFDEDLSHYCNPIDSDNDGVSDDQDNCILVPNGPFFPDVGGNSQLDTDGDGYGNMCDGDLNQSGFVDFADLTLFSSMFFTADANADLDGSSFVQFADLTLFSSLFFQPPGPSCIDPPGVCAP